MKRNIFFLLLFVCFLIPQSVFSQTLIYSPQRVTGWEGLPSASFEWRTDYWILNLTQNPVSVLAIFTDQISESITQTVTLPDGEKDLSGYTLNLKGNESQLVKLSASSCDSNVNVGTIAFLVPTSYKNNDQEPTPDVAINVIYRRLDASGTIVAAAGVTVGENATLFSFPVEINPGTDAGVAVFNLNPVRVYLTFSLIDENRIVAIANKSLKPGEQISKYASEIFPGVDRFSGRIEVQSDQSVAATALKLYYNMDSVIFAGIPIVRQ
jgi:hypothetical protein